jgi:hypothetical protein
MLNFTIAHEVTNVGHNRERLSSMAGQGQSGE